MTGAHEGTGQPVLLDTFCKAGGCTRGYQLAGYYVVGVDIEAQPNYCGDEFIQADALDYLATADLSRYAAIHASPPCQKYSKARNLQGNEHPDLIAPVRELLRASGKPYVIENVQGAPLLNPITLVGSMFGLRTMRPRLFECSFDVPFVLAPPAAAKHAKMGRPPQPGEYVHVVGHMSDVAYCREAIGIGWMTQKELAQAIPPTYCKWIGERLMETIGVTTP
jgi:DNA (cytosine-5)-methyltransferase 1